MINISCDRAMNTSLQTESSIYIMHIVYLLFHNIIHVIGTSLFLYLKEFAKLKKKKNLMILHNKAQMVNVNYSKVYVVRFRRTLPSKKKGFYKMFYLHFMFLKVSYAHKASMYLL